MANTKHGDAPMPMASNDDGTDPPIYCPHCQKRVKSYLLNAYRCKYCKESFCSTHHLDVSVHKCKNIAEYREEKKKLLNARMEKVVAKKI